MENEREKGRGGTRQYLKQATEWENKIQREEKYWTEFKELSSKTQHSPIQPKFSESLWEYAQQRMTSQVSINEVP